MNNASEHTVAVVGMSCRYPSAENLDAFWDLIREGRSGLTTLNEQALLAAGVSRRNFTNPNYIPVAGLLPDPLGIDPKHQQFFGHIAPNRIPPNHPAPHRFTGRWTIFHGHVCTGVLVPPARSIEACARQLLR